MSDRVGAYGLSLPTLPGRQWLQPVPASWPTWTHDVIIREAGDVPFSADENHASLPLIDGASLSIDRREQRINYYAPAPPPDASWVHPILSPPAIFAADWAARLAFHAGAFLDRRGRAWIVFGQREDGKSTALAWLAMQDRSVLTDDLVVTDGRTVMAGPRCVDLRLGAADRLQVGEAVATLGGRDRVRVGLDEAPAESPLAGFIRLGWHDQDAQMVEVPTTTERVTTVGEARALLVAQQHPLAWLSTLAVPVFRFQRRRSWDDFDQAMNRLVQVTDAFGG